MTTFDNMNSEAIEKLHRTKASKIARRSPNTKDCAIIIPEANDKQYTLDTSFIQNGFQMANKCPKIVLRSPIEEYVIINQEKKKAYQDTFNPHDTFNIKTCQMTDV